MAYRYEESRALTWNNARLAELYNEGVRLKSLLGAETNTHVETLEQKRIELGAKQARCGGLWTDYNNAVAAEQAAAAAAAANT